MSPAQAPIHQEVSGNIHAQLHALLKKKNCKVYAAPFDVRLPAKDKKEDNEITTVVQPDISVICDGSKIDGRGCCGAPDLVIEILSPGNSHKEVKVKFELYEEAGVPEYWIVNPVEANLVVYVINDTREYSGGKMYSGKDKIKSRAIPELIVDTSEMFTK
jgi:Uma2 family endonuclease